MTTDNRRLAWPDGWHILCVRLDNLGDVLLTTPAFRALKETFPNARLTLLTSSVGAAVAPLVPELDRTIVFDVPWVASTAEPNPAALLTMATRLAQERFDAAVIFTVQSQNPLPAALLCYLAGIPRVLSFCRENPYRLVSDWVPDPDVLVATQHEVSRQLALVSAIGATTAHQGLSLQLPAQARHEARHALQTAGIDPAQPYILLHPGVSEEKRRYPAQDFAEAARRLCRQQGIPVVLTGSTSEAADAERLRGQIGIGAVSLAGRLDLLAFAGLIADAALLIANNTGPVHLAAALGTPVVVAYAKTNPQHTPWQVPNRVLYFDVPVHLRSRNVLLQNFPEPALPTASPDAIVQAAGELLARTTPGQRPLPESETTYSSITNP
jgi:lipopolysaccharide heptosyltransferase II